jgi:hypothetical protein
MLVLKIVLLVIVLVPSVTRGTSWKMEFVLLVILIVRNVIEIRKIARLVRMAWLLFEGSVNLCVLMDALNVKILVLVAK